MFTFILQDWDNTAIQFYKRLWTALIEGDVTRDVGFLK